MVVLTILSHLIVKINIFFYKTNTVYIFFGDFF